MSQLSAKASVFKPINYIGEISKEVSSQGLGDLFTATSYVKSKSVLLATAICFIRDSFGKMQEVRALLDGGSTSSFISQQCMNRLNLKREKINILVSGLNNSELTIKSRVNATIANRGNSYETNADFFVVPRITDMIPSQPFNVSLGNFSREKLADENFNIPGNIDLLLGAEIFYKILLPGQTNLLNTKLIFQNTVFGYIASGSIPVSSENKPHCGLIKDNVDLEKTMRRFWEIENVEPETIKNKETIICAEHFQKNHTRDNQRKLQRILWRENMDEPIKTFELSTVTYGTTSAPFLATRTLKQLALDETGNFPLGSSVVMSDMYIDDVLTGAETLLEAKELKNQLINIFAKGGMVLHKWCGNNTELIEVSENYDFSDSSEIKLLGVYWNPKHDCFSFRVKIDLHELNTKRDVLSSIARIYDPLGLLGPVVAKAKIFFQKLWMLKIDWTDLLPDTINREWRQFVESLQVVNDININRCIVVEQPEVIELHGLSDASQSAYGAVVYCKSITSDGKMLVHLIASKSRVAPTKQTTIPRLELCAAVLLAKLVHRVKQALKLNVTNTFLWSDSMIVLSWIRKESYQLKTFVANRIATIQEMTSSEQWRYVATEDNPADFVSRGMDSLKLKTCELWWNGPKFLMSNQNPQRQIPVAVIKDPGELKNCSDFSNFFLDSATNSFVNNLLNLSNDYFKIIRVLSFICRFVYNCKNKESKRIGPLDLGELKKAEQLLLKLLQKEEFKVEMNGIQNSAMVPSNSRVKTLNPFIDSEGILRVGGRLRNSDINYNQKFPILLPSKHKLTYLIVEYFHKKVFT
ncbi:integrase catalytic domain-containing protein [Trichonephila clavipes]|nr:integrase catalytic domain-containing protein [Trichonephila clavipes]